MITGDKIQGKITKGFIMIGKPNNIGSFTLNLEAGVPNLAISLFCLLLQRRKIPSTTAKVPPVPPMPTKHVSINCLVMLFGSCTPCLDGARFSLFTDSEVG